MTMITAHAQAWTAKVWDTLQQLTLMFHGRQWLSVVEDLGSVVQLPVR